MSDSDWVLNDDGSRYAVVLQVPDDPSDPYSVDLVRHAQDERGLLREQRLTLAQYNSYGEAEEHFYQAEQQMQMRGLDDFDVDALATMPYSDTPTVLTPHYSSDADTEELAVAPEQHAPATPLFDPHDGAVRHVDGGGTAHWFAVVEGDDPERDPYELRYFRALTLDDGSQHQDSYAVMPLPDDDPGSAWALPALELYLQKGDVYMAQQLAHDVADTYEQKFPEPLDLPALDPNPEYYFGYGISDNNEPSLEAVKTWMGGAERRFDTLTIGEYGMYEEAAVYERELEMLMDEKGLEAAMNLAESMAVSGGYLDPERDDPRIFFEDDAPPDMFMTNRQRELNIPFYGLGAISANGESFLDVMKIWGKDNYERLVVPQPDWETAVTTADVAGGLLEGGHLQKAMRLVELAGMEAGVIDPDREDGRLFTQGPTDPFQTIRQAQLMQPDVAGLEQAYHRLDVREVQTSNGESLGYSVIASAYPQLPADLDDEEMDDMLYPNEAWALELAHFNVESEAQEFAAEHRETPLTELAEGAVGGSWQQWNMSDINRFMSRKPQVMDAEDWQPQSDTYLLHSLDPTVNYALVVNETDSESLELAVEKHWRQEGDSPGMVTQIIQSYSASEQKQALADQNMLKGIYHQRGLEAMMHKAELQAMQNGYLDPHRVNLALFPDGPEDRFETLAQQLENETNPYWNTEGEVIDEPEPEPSAQNPYWRLDIIPVNDPDGEALGHALHMVVYDGSEHDSERVGTPPMTEDEPFRMLEMAHFETTEAADKFGKEFNGYLMPGLLEGPELAVEVARLEELPVDWKTLAGDDLKAYQDGQYTLTRDLSDWHPYNPNAERDARIEAERLYTNLDI